MKNTSTHYSNSPVIEALEARIAPASVLVYTDTDGDQVTIVSSRGTLAGHATFDQPSGEQQLETLDLTDPSFSHANITVLVHRASGGDGNANIGYINATGNDLGRVVVPGDLGRISAGDGNPAHLAVGQLFVRSMGAVGTSTQAGGEPLIDLSAVTSQLTQLLGQNLNGTNGTLSTVLQEAGSLLHRPDLSDSARRLLSQLVSDGQGVINEATSSGGTPDHLPAGLGQLLSMLETDVQNVTALGTANPGLLGTNLTDQLGTVGTDISPVVALDGMPAPVSVNLTGLLGSTLGTTPGSSQAASLLQNVGTALNGISPDILSNLTPDLANLLGTTNTEVGNLLNHSTPVTAGALHDLATLQSTLAADLSSPGAVPASAQAALTGLTHSLSSLLGTASGSSTGGAPALMTSDLNGSLGQFFSRFHVDGVFLNVNGNIARAVIGTSLMGGADPNTGEIYASGNINRVTIGGDVVGGSNLNTGFIQAGGRVNSVLIGGSLLGGSGNDSAAIALNGDTPLVAIGGDVSGGDGLFSGSVTQSDGSIRTLLIGGGLISGSDSSSAAISATDTIGTLRIGRGVFADADHRAAIVAGGIHSQIKGRDPAFGLVLVKGLVNDLDLMAGYDVSLNPVNGSAGIGGVVILGDLSASNIVAGTMTADGTKDFGTSSDHTIAMHNPDIVGRISAVVILGNTFGTPNASDHFGIEANEIGRVSVNGMRLPSAPGAGNDHAELSGNTDDVTVREVGAPQA